MISIIDYGMSNIRSISNAFEILGEMVSITNDKKVITDSEAIVLPGVGAFGDGINNLQKMNLIELLKELVLDKKKPYLGVCLGLEFLAEKSYENGIHDGFGWIRGEVVKIKPENQSLKVPHMGWDDTRVIIETDLMRGLENPIFYYLHSYYFKVAEVDKKCITSLCNYGGVEITSSLKKDNIYAVQFHPEKSQATGIQLIKNFLEDVRK